MEAGRSSKHKKPHYHTQSNNPDQKTGVWVSQHVVEDTDGHNENPRRSPSQESLEPKTSECTTEC
jgi:hypothetical protein